MAAGYPLLIKHRRAEVKIYPKRAGYAWYRIAYYSDGARILRSFKKLSEARCQAKRIARELSAGSKAPALSRQAANAAVFALDQLKILSEALGLSKPIRLEDAIVEYAEAKSALGPVRLISAIKGYLSTVAQIRRVPVRQSVDEYLAARDRLSIPSKVGKRPELSPKLAYQDRLRLNRFAKGFVMDVCDLTKDHFDLFFREHVGDLSAKSRNHYRGTLRHWVKYCVACDYLPANHRLMEGTELKNQKSDGGEIEIYTATEFAAFLAKAEGPLKVLLAIGGLAGLRTQELLRLDWADLWRRPGYIEVGKAKAKTRQRRLVPILPALAAWLDPWRQFKQGPIWTFHEITFHDHLRQVAEAAGVERKDNALRHTFISVRLAETHNENQVAQEAGTSPSLIHRNYRQLVTLAEAKEWFGVMPLEPTHQIEPPLQPANCPQKEGIPATAQKCQHGTRARVPKSKPRSVNP